jgi:hypothetical protein
MLVGIHQPHYLPWLRYFDKIARCDVFIVLDTVQFSKNGWQNRNRIKTASGTVLLTVPVLAALDETLDTLRIDNTQPWRKKHWRTIELSYAKAPHFADHASFLMDVYTREWDRLNDLNRHMLAYLVDALGIQTRVVHASQLEVPGTATERLVNLIKAVGGNRYYTGAFAMDAYLDRRLLEQAGIELQIQDWHAPEYPQLHGEFMMDLSIIDLIVNCGHMSLDILLGATS